MSSACKRKYPQSLESTLNHEAANGVPSKRNKPNSTPLIDIPTLERLNFVKACELVSQEAYLNYAERLQLIYMPVCMDRNSCMHSSTKPSNIMEIPQTVMKLVNVEMGASNWCEALEICIISITPTQYLTDGMLKTVVEIMLNAHEDLSSDYTISHVLDKCKQVLSLHFSIHCPCLHEDIRKIYTNFLTSPMDTKERTRSNRAEYGSKKGIVNFCLNRLEHELGADSADGALLDKTENTPHDIRQTIKGLFYQKEQFDIFEMLDRTERINRLMAVLHSIIELVQFDLAIWQSIGNSDMRRPLKGQKTLMEFVLWQNNGLCSVPNICLQILKLFSYFIHLEYPEEHIRTMSLWVNAVMEIFYMKEKKSNYNYPSAGSNCKLIVKEFYEIISDLPPKSIINILERIKPAHIRHQISHHHCNILLSSDEKETFQMLINFLKKCKWKDFPSNESNVVMLKKLKYVKRVKPNKLLENLSKICRSPPSNLSHNNKLYYAKYCPCPTAKDCEIDQNLITCTLYITLQSYLEAYGVQIVQNTLRKLNEDLTKASPSEYRSFTQITKSSSYGVNDDFLKKYRNIFKMLKELIWTIKEMESGISPPEILRIFKNFFN